MPDLAVQPYVLTNALLEIDADNYAAHVSSCKLVPTHELPTVKWQGAAPNATFVEAGTPSTSWAFVISAAQDWTSAKSLSQYLHTNNGLTKTIKLTPQSKKGKLWTFSAVIVAGEIGADVNSVATQSVSMPVNGQPAQSAAPTV